MTARGPMQGQRINHGQHRPGTHYRKPTPATDLDWQNLAACRDKPLDLFFGVDDERDNYKAQREAAAKQVCAQCPVRLSCLEHALQLPENHGVWGATGERERAMERNRRQKADRRAAQREAG